MSELGDILAKLIAHYICYMCKQFLFPMKQNYKFNDFLKHSLTSATIQNSPVQV